MRSTKRRSRVEKFRVDRANDLVRAVVPRRGRPYKHRCTKESFEAVVFAIEQNSGGFTLESLVAAEDLPFTQVSVALAFLKERGIVETGPGRKCYATGGNHLDAMVEFFAMKEEV